MRHERTANLFFDERVEAGLSVRCDDLKLEMSCREGTYRGEYISPGNGAAGILGDDHTIREVSYSQKGDIVSPIRFYRSPRVKDFCESRCSFLLPPDGANLPSLLLGSQELRRQTNLAFVAQELRLAFPGQGNRLELLKNYDDIITSYPYKLAAESLQRRVFYTTAIDTNLNATLLFEEPEAHSFPGDVHLLAEIIALEENRNQYFITTHSDNFLMSHICKVPSKDLGVHIVYEKAHQTRVRTLSEAEIPELFEVNVFLNWDIFVNP